jgi:hypothetical protein
MCGVFSLSGRCIADTKALYCRKEGSHLCLLCATWLPFLPIMCTLQAAHSQVPGGLSAEAARLLSACGTMCLKPGNEGLAVALAWPNGLLAAVADWWSDAVSLERLRAGRRISVVSGTDKVGKKSPLHSSACAPPVVVQCISV